jgi:Zn-finger in ubiquitin-hydrolases and other protein
MNDEINPRAKPSGTGCVECLAGDAWWLHLRRCAECGHIDCCDSSPNQHARAHFENAKHSVIASFEPNEDWFYDFRTEEFIDGPKLVAPHSHPLDQPAPGPHGRVPKDWQEMLH